MISDETQKVKTNAAHFTAILLWQYAYCLVLFFCLSLIPWQTRLTESAVGKIVWIYYVLLLLAPTMYNGYRILVAWRRNDNAKISNHLIVQTWSFF